MMSHRGSTFCDRRAGRVADLPERALSHGAAAGDVAAQATPVFVDQGTPAMFQHDRTAGLAKMAFPAEHDASVPVGTPADARTAPVSQRLGLRVDLAQSGRDESCVECQGLAVDGAQAELIGRILRGELYFAGRSMGKLGLVGPETRLLRGLLTKREGMQLVPPCRCRLGRDAFAGTQADAERGVGVDVPLRAARRQRVADLALAHADVAAEVQQLELEESGEGLAGAYRN